MSDAEPVVELAHHVCHEGTARIRSDLVKEPTVEIVLEQSDGYSLSGVVIGGVQVRVMREMFNEEDDTVVAVLVSRADGYVIYPDRATISIRLEAQCLWCQSFDASLSCFLAERTLSDVVPHSLNADLCTRVELFCKIPSV